MILRSRLVLPISQPPLENGAVHLVGSRVAAIGPWEALKCHAGTGQVVDLGEVILMPGLVNAHCHLDYTRMGGKIQPLKRFTDWIKAMVALKAEWSYTEFAESWLDGVGMLLRTGTTTVADIEAVPEILPEGWEATPLRVLTFRELINIRSRHNPEDQVRLAVEELEGLKGSNGRVGLSPHAPYTATKDLLQHAAQAASRRKWRLTTHLAESEEEFQMFMYRSGPLYDWLKGQRDMQGCGDGSPVQFLDRCGYLSENLLAVHVNYLTGQDAELLGRRRVSVAHCPNSHAYFKHLRFPFEELTAAGVNLCLGTDSSASMLKTPGRPLELNLFSEMQAFSKSRPELNPATILRMATVQGARALGLTGRVGEISPDACADLIVLPFAGDPADAYAHVLHHRGPVGGSMIDGRWVISPESAAGQTL